MQQTLADIDLTEEDFSTLREALDALAKKQNEGSLIGALFDGLMKDNMPGRAYAELQAEKKKLDDKRRIEANDKIDQIFTLQYKLTQLRKYLKWASETPASDTHTEEATGEAPQSPES
jgi:hypothetical protein